MNVERTADGRFIIEADLLTVRQITQALTLQVNKRRREAATATGPIAIGWAKQDIDRLDTLATLLHEAQK